MMRSFRGILMAVMSLGLISTVLAAEHTAPASAAAVPYPLDKCIISGEKLGGMGEPVVKVYDGREVKFCCNGCVKTFEKDEAKYFKKIDEAIVAEQKPTYPLSTCVVTGEKLDGGEMTPVDYVYKNQLVRFCCKNCIKTFEKDPDKYLSKLHAAAATNKQDTKTEEAK
jgi:YHS domain-containing protein